jgi:cysteinyl-tRNA synthetase
MQLQFYNTASKRLEEFKPLNPGEARLYTCGPTVYNFAHIGNFRAYVFEDILVRVLAYAGYKVTQVMNLTDVDDKTIKGCRAAGIPLKEYTKPYIDAFFEDIKTLNITPAAKYPAATDHIPEMQALIAKLFENGLAYKSDDGSVYFNVAKFPNYGHPAHIDVGGMRGGARVSQDEYEKESVGDFALWKGYTPEDGEVVWDSPWGRGRPGWHIECSAMSMKYLGETFDLHTGGIDNLFPHHANETAQAEGATGKPFVNCWLHCAHLRLNGEKMSKSLGNFYTLRDLLKMGWTGREIRFVLVGGHYRQVLNFTFDALAQARTSLARIDAFVSRLKDLVPGSQFSVPGSQAAPAPEPSNRQTVKPSNPPLPLWAEEAQAAFEKAISDDLNMPEALAALFGLIRDGNTALDAAASGDGRSPSGHAFEAARCLELLRAFDAVFGFIFSAKADEALPADVQAQLDARAAARKAKQWAESDRIRDALRAAGWEVKDTPQGQKVRRM